MGTGYGNPVAAATLIELTLNFKAQVQSRLRNTLLGKSSIFLDLMPGIFRCSGAKTKTPGELSFP